MEFNYFEEYFSTQRISRYLSATDYSRSRAIHLYKENLKISQAFHPLLGVLEVILRNKLNDILSLHFDDPNWIINQKSGFMSDNSLRFKNKTTGNSKINDFLKKEIVKAEKRLLKSGIPITSGKIIAEQTFGFWTDLFAVHHYRLLKGRSIQIFQSLPSGKGRKEVTDELNKVRRFRNRINHNEPICFNGDIIDFTQVLEVHHSIIKLLTWIDPQLVVFVSDIDTVQATINSAKKV